MRAFIFKMYRMHKQKWCVSHSAILDVVVDLRKDKKTFGKSFRLEMSAEKGQQLLSKALLTVL